jgi:hypothetical protein
MRLTVHTTAQTSTLLRPVAPEFSYEDYLHISQSARARALVARRAASQAFWSGVARWAGRVVRSFGQHASVRLGAGHRITHAGA